MRASIAIATSFILVFIVSVFPVDLEWRWLRPEFAVLMVIYWSIYAPQHFGIVAAWCVGLLQDMIEFGLLGHHALVLSIVAYLCQLFYQRIRQHTIWQQSGWVFLFVSLDLFLSYWISGMRSREVADPFLLSSALVSAFLWPLMVVLCEGLTRRSRWYSEGS